MGQLSQAIACTQPRLSWRQHQPSCPSVYPQIARCAAKPEVPQTCEESKPNPAGDWSVNMAGQVLAAETIAT